MNPRLDFSIYTGFLYRFSILLFVIKLINSKNFLAGIVLYSYSASNLIRSNRLFHSSSFVLIGIFSAVAIVYYLFRNDDDFNDNLLFSKQKMKLKQFINYFQKTASFIVLFLFIWINIRSSFFLVNNYEKFSFQSNFSKYINTSSQIRLLACGIGDVKLLSYPLNPQIYYWSDIEPASSQIFLLPWNAEVYLDKVLDDLKFENNVIIIINKEAMIWEKYEVSDYANELINFLDTNYILLENGYYVSKPLYLSCKD